MQVTYLNLSLGLCCEQPPLSESVRYCRLQSSQLEANRYDKFLMSVPDDLIFCFLLGFEIQIVDGSHDPGNSQLLIKGIPLLNYFLRTYVLLQDPNTLTEEHLQIQSISRARQNLSNLHMMQKRLFTQPSEKEVRNKYRYYRKLANCRPETKYWCHPITLKVIKCEDSETSKRLMVWKTLKTPRSWTAIPKVPTEKGRWWGTTINPAPHACWDRLEQMLAAGRRKR